MNQLIQKEVLKDREIFCLLKNCRCTFGPCSKIIRQQDTFPKEKEKKIKNIY